MLTRHIIVCNIIFGYFVLLGSNYAGVYIDVPERFHIYLYGIQFIFQLLISPILRNGIVSFLVSRPGRYLHAYELSYTFL